MRIGLLKFGIKTDAHKDLYTREALIDARESAKKNSVASIHKNRAYNDLDTISALINTRSQLSFKIQKDLGLRVKEATYIKESQLKENNNIEITQKGGNKTIRKINPQLYKQIKNEIKNNNGVFQINRATYTRDLKQAVEKAKEDWNGTHGIRYNYAQDRFKELQQQNYSKENALAKVSQEMGHTRIEISIYYLNGL